MHPCRKYIFIIASLVVLSGKAQVLLPGSMDEEYYRLFTFKNPQLDQPITYFPSIIYNYALDSTIWDVWDDFSRGSLSSFALVKPRINFNYNTKLNRGYNDGPVWNGKGFNTSISAGFNARKRISNHEISITFNPVISYAQNKFFNIPEHNFNKSQFSYPFEKNIDFVQRYGNQPYKDFHLGQSAIEYSYKKIAIAFSTQNMKWGPAYYNPILMSNQAAGFPHVSFGTKTPLNTKIGKIETKIFWGALKESNYLDTISSNDRRYFTGILLGYQPKFIKGISIGIHRVLYRSWGEDELRPKDWFSSLTNFSPKYRTNVGGGTITNDFYDQIASVSINWRYPQAGFEAYVEFARNDFPWNLDDFIRHPDRSRAYVLGFNQVFELTKNELIKFQYEHTTLSANQTQMVNSSGSPNFYTHGIVAQGYTHLGQIVGAGIGTGSNTDIFKLDYYNASGVLGLSAQRIRFNDDYILPKFFGQKEYQADFEFTFGINYLRLFGNFSVNTFFNFSYRYNWYYIKFNNEPNFHFGLNVAYDITAK